MLQALYYSFWMFRRKINLFLQPFSYLCKNWIEPTIFHHKCQHMENMTECGFVYLFRDHTRYEIMSNFDVKHSQVVSLFFFWCSVWKMWQIVVWYSLAQKKDPNHFLSSARCRLVWHSEQHRKISTICNPGNQLSYILSYFHLAKTQRTVFELQISKFTNCYF